jgi:thiosulfate dehydrogenase
MIKFLFGVIIGIGLLLLAEYLFVARGGFLSNKAIEASIGKSARDDSPLPADESNLLAGAQIYERSCAGCHGRLDQPAPAMGKKFYPHAPQLLPPGEGVTDDPVGAIHWVVKNGIRFSAMPSFEGRLTDNEIWQVSQFLHNADKLPPPVQESLHQSHPE